MESASVWQLWQFEVDKAKVLWTVAKLLPQWCMTFNQLVVLMPVIAVCNIAVNFMVTVRPVIVIVLCQQTLATAVKD